jgi:uncharacterized lipoprotein YajG
MRQAQTARNCLVALFLLILLAGCGTQGHLANTANPAPTSNMSGTQTGDQSVRLTPNKKGIFIDQSGLHVDASDGAQCPLRPVTTGNNLVLATDRLTYDANELQQISEYVNSVDHPTTPVPDTLRWVLGGYTSDIYACGISLGLTNTSQNSIQISNAGVQLAGDTQQNNYHYRLIDICTITPYCRSGGGPSNCSQYFATIKLGTGPINTVFSAIPVGISSCGELTLHPGDEKTLYVYIYSAQNLIYSVVPQLVLTTDTGPNTLNLTKLTSTLAFANDSQFTCYALHGDTFVAETPQRPNSNCL